MARDPDALKIRKWAASSSLVQTPEAAGLTRATGLPASYGASDFLPLEVWNQIEREVTGAAVEIPQRGILEWDAAQRYEHPSWVTGSDGNLYSSVQASGGADPSQDPTTDTNDTYWEAFTVSVSNSSTNARGIIRTATVAEDVAGTATSPASTPAGLKAAIADALMVAISEPDQVFGAGLAVGDRRLIASWVEPDNNGANITGYIVQWREDSQGFSTSRQQTINALTYTITGLTNGDTYHVRVRAVNSEGNGPWSNEVTAIPITGLLATNIMLSSFIRVTQALAGSMDGFEWLGAELADGTWDLVEVVDVTAITQTGTELLGVVIDDSAETLQLYAVNSTTGALTARGAAQDIEGDSKQGVGFASDGSTLFASVLDDSAETLQLYAVNSTTGALTARGAAQDIGLDDWEGVGLAWNGSTLFAWVIATSLIEARLFAVNRATGALTARGTRQSLPSASFFSAALEWDGSDLLALALEGNLNNPSSRLFSVNSVTGALTARGTSQSLPAGRWDGAGLAWNGSDLLLWLVNDTLHTARLYEVNRVTGALTARGTSQSLPAGVLDAAGLVLATTEAGGVVSRGLRFDRAGPSTLGLRSDATVTLTQIVGLNSP